ncbi:MAG TPA: protein kinase [Labilithrix sp.]
MGSPQPPTSELAEGSVLAGKYRLVRRLGAGGMCIVWEAQHTGLKQAVAVKVLKPELADDKNSVERFEREAKAVAQLRNTNVARVVDVDWLPNGVPFMTMELLIGQDLGKELTRLGRVPVEVAVDYVRQACNGIGEAHALGIVHRDVKPENLFLCDLGDLTDRKLVKLLDFGIAKTLTEDERKLTVPGSIFGTVDYMSPEQIRSASTVDHRSDLWSLGVILYELVTGRTPFMGDARAVIAGIASDPVRPPTAYVPDLAPSLVAIIMKALAKDREQRFQSAEELRDALAPFSELDEITSVLSQLPAASMPRRSTRPPATSSRPHARTSESWEQSPAKRGWSKTWLFSAIAIVCLAGALALVVRMRGLASFTTSQVAPPPPQPATPAPSVTASTSVVAIPTEPAPPESVASADPTPPATSAPAKPKKRRPPPGSPHAPGEPPPKSLPDHL